MVEAIRLAALRLCRPADAVAGLGRAEVFLSALASRKTARTSLCRSPLLYTETRALGHSTER